MSYKISFLLVSLFIASCTYGPAETNYVIEAAARKPNSYQAIAVVYKRTFLPPTGISTFPNGGVDKLLSSSVSFYLIDMQAREQKMLLTMAVPDNQGQAFSAGIVGWLDSTIHVQLNGCEGNECRGDLVNRSFYKLLETGELTLIDNMNQQGRFKGGSLAPMEGERNYARLSVYTDKLKAILQDGGEQQLLFTLDPETGLLHTP
jgi:hypothetical protein